MGRYVRGSDNFEYKYRGPSCLCELEEVSGVGRTEIFPEIAFCEVDDGEDLVCHLNGENDCIPVDQNETAFDTFQDFFFSMKKYFENADTQSLVEILEDENGIEEERELLKMINSAENVMLSAGCYYTLLREEWPIMLDWVNEHLEDSAALTLADLTDEAKSVGAIQSLTKTSIKNDDDLPLLACLLLRDAVLTEDDEYVAHDLDEVWVTPLVQDGEVVTPDTEIGEFEDYMF